MSCRVWEADLMDFVYQKGEIHSRPYLPCECVSFNQIWLHVGSARAPALEHLNPIIMRKLLAMGLQDSVLLWGGFSLSFLITKQGIFNKRSQHK